jgi:spore germination protein YaaH
VSRFLGILAVIALLALIPPGGVRAQTDSSGASTGGRRLVLGYYVPYDPTSWESLQQQAQPLDAVGAQWVTVDPCGGLTSQDDQTLKQLARARGVAVFPSLLTTTRWLNHQLLTDEAAAANAVDQIASYVTEEDYEGFDLDLENVDPADRAPYSAFVARLADALHARGKWLALALPAKASDLTTGWAGAYDYAALGGLADLVTIMTYDEHGAWGAPGPVASYPWVDRVIAFTTSQIPPDKVLVGLAFYGYDWNTTTGAVKSLSYAQAARSAAYHGVPISLDPSTKSATFRYQALVGDVPPAPPRSPKPNNTITSRTPPPCGVVGPPPTPTPTPRPTSPPGTVESHEVWLEESASAAARLTIADRYGAGGVAAWRVGLEDPQVWSIFQQWRAAR